ncbi:hypothetical protein [Bartonella gabonensis]|nr:hypothetical protein [Bartonella gabonensis]
MKEQNWISEQETLQRIYSFSFQQALLSTKDYKVIFVLSVIIIIALGD